MDSDNRRHEHIWMVIIGGMIIYMDGDNRRQDHIWTAIIRGMTTYGRK